MREKTLSVGLPGRHVGDLLQNRDGLLRWLPERAWEAEGQHPRLGTDFLRKPGPRQQGTGLLPWFENLLPEDHGELRKRLCAAHGLRAGQSFALLAALGHDLAGAVMVTRDAAPDGDADESHLDGGVEDTARASLKLIQKLSSLAGMQLKFSMSMVQERLALPARGAGGQWIVKLPGNEYAGLPEVEHMTMTWAQRAGFDVPSHFVVDVERLDGIPAGWIEDGATHAFAVKRFDRQDDGSKLHQEDLCQALDLPPTNKYGDSSPHVSFDGALRFVTDICGEPSGREMAQRMGFAIASGNGDAHLKNWSLLWGNMTRPTLAPCYDLVATVSWAQQLGWDSLPGPSLALRIGGEQRFAHLDDQVLAAHAAKCGLPWASEELMAGIIRAKDTWRYVAHEAPQAMRAAVGTHWNRVPILLRLGL